MTHSSDGRPVSPADGAVFLDRLAQLRRRFVERTQQDAIAIAALRDRWRRGEPLVGELLREMTRAAHGLSGAAGIFGFEAISEAAHRLERSLRSLDEPPPDPGPLFDALVEELAALGASDVSS